MNLGKLQKKNDAELYLAIYPCVNKSKCKSIYLEKKLVEVSNKTQIFKVVPIATDLQQKFDNNHLNPSLFMFKNDEHATRYGHKMLSEYFVNYIK